MPENRSTTRPTDTMPDDDAREAGRFKNPPIARHESLAPLSRDHYRGLQHARRLRDAGADRRDPRDALQRFIRDWDAEIASHFEDEERLLTGWMSSDELDRLGAEHQAIRELARSARDAVAAKGGEPGEVAGELGDRLQAHIRWEERTLFPAIEGRASDEQLRALCEATDRIERSRDRNRCEL